MITSARTQAIQIAKEKLAPQDLNQRPFYLDTETTGNTPNDEIIQIGIIDDEGQVVFDSLVRPIGKSSPEALRVHHITDEMLAAAPRWMHVWPQVEAVVAGHVIGIYNADFDLRLIQQTHAKYKIRSPFPGETFCIMKLYAQFYGEWNSSTRSYRWQSLETAGRQCRIALPNTHRAIDDTLLTRAILHFMANS